MEKKEEIQEEKQEDRIEDILELCSLIADNAPFLSLEALKTAANKRYLREILKYSCMITFAGHKILEDLEVDFPDAVANARLAAEHAFFPADDSRYYPAWHAPSGKYFFPGRKK